MVRTILFPIAGILLLLGGCASYVPEAIRKAPPGPTATVQEVRADPERFVGTQVRWGGTIAQVQNRKDGTWIQVVARDLANDGRPRADDRSMGRFVATFDRFLDPMVYSQGRSITVVGTLGEVATISIGDYPYRFPVVKVQQHYLWEPLREVERIYGPSPWYYDPWYYDPWYRYHWPYRPYWW